MRNQLTDAGVPEHDLAAVDEAVRRPVLGNRSVAAFASQGTLWSATQLPDFEDGDSAAWAAWPRLIPLLRWEQHRLPVVTAVLRHGSAELAAYDADGALVADEFLQGPDDEIESNAPGGWSQPRYQRRAVDSWAHNAAAFADRIARLAARVGAGLVVLAGDVRETHLVADRLPPAVAATATTCRARPLGDGHSGVRPEDLHRLVADAAAARRAALLEEFEEAVGQHGAVEGPADVRRTLDVGAVLRLVVVAGVVADELADVMTAAALDADADVLVADPEEIDLVGGIGAVLRF
jgi:hypothetical protein